jgi:hypothetical protein
VTDVRSSTNGSVGAMRVRESFNPSKDNIVDKIKRYTADLIDLCEDLKAKSSTPSGVPTQSGNSEKALSAEREQNRLAALAMTAYEEAAMWAVKAATTQK